ncbi:MAG: glycosyltransferase family 4 protein [Lachnospiraceae bacterium]|nr:glycosyltransferase family 4 protein [Lachnospiraceae bacterium]
MNILFMAHESRLGGANLSLLGIIDELAGRHNISVAVPIKRGFMVDELRKRNIPVYYRHSFWWMLAPAATDGKTFIKKMAYKVLCLNNYLCALSLLSIVRKQKIDIIHTNSSVLNTGGILSRMTGVPHVWHIREFALKGLGFFPVWDYRRLCAFIDSHSDQVVTISQAIAQEFQNKISPDKIKVVYNGVNEEHNRQKSGIREDGSRVEFLISGRNNPEKGLDEAIRAVGLLVKEGYSNLHLSMAGTEVADNLERLIEECHVRDYVSYLGMIKDMPSLRQKMDVELVCSVCEGFGRVTAESLMSSNPVIGADTGGTPELIRNGENGYLYHRGDIEDLAQKMKIFLDNPGQIRTLGDNGYTWSTRMFTQKKNAEEIEKVYFDVLKGKEIK